MTATKVPAWTAISNINPKSLTPNNIDGSKRCAELEIGKNSVRPWMHARKRANKISEIIFFDTLAFLNKQGSHLLDQILHSLQAHVLPRSL